MKSPLQVYMKMIKSDGAQPEIFLYFFFWWLLGLFCAPWACLYIISSAGVVSGTPHPAV